MLAERDRAHAELTGEQNLIHAEELAAVRFTMKAVEDELAAERAGRTSQPPATRASQLPKALENGGRSVLCSDMLLLRPLATSDFDTMYGIASDPLVWEQHPSKDRAQEPVFRQWFREALASQGAVVAVDRSNGEVIGTSRYEDRKSVV